MAEPKEGIHNCVTFSVPKRADVLTVEPSHLPRKSAGQPQDQPADQTESTTLDRELLTCNRILRIGINLDAPREQASMTVALQPRTETIGR